MNKKSKLTLLIAECLKFLAVMKKKTIFTRKHIKPTYQSYKFFIEYVLNFKICYFVKTLLCLHTYL